MSTDTAAFIATTKEEVGRCMAIAQRALEDRKPATVGDLLDALDIIATRIKAYRSARPESTNTLSTLLEDVAHARSALAEDMRKRFKPMSPHDLPAGVTARSMAHPAGPCYAFHHDDLGELGRIVLLQTGLSHIELRAEVHENSRGKADHESLFREVISRIGQSLKQLDPHESPWV